VSDRAAPLAGIVGIVRDYVAAKGDRAAAKFFAVNSKAVYKWPKR